MSSPVTITLLGEPKGKGRGRVGKLANGMPTVFTPASTRSYEASLKYAATQEMGNRPPLAGAVEVTMLAQFLVPVSWSKKKRAAALAGEIPATRRPDVDNAAKAVFDAFNKVVWADDAQVITCTIRKRYGTQALLCITAKEIGAP